MYKKIIATTIASATLVYANTVPNSSSIQKELAKPKIPQKQEQLVPIEGIKKFVEPMKKEDISKTIFIKSFKISGNTKLSSKKLLSLIQSFENQALNFNQIQEIASKITKAYRNNGYFIARAYIPKQRIKNGVLNITVLEGEYDEFLLNNSSDVQEFILKGILNQTKKEQVISEQGLETAMLRINDLSGVTISKTQIKAGSKTGTSSFVIETSKTPKVDGYAVADNHGSRYTGENRLSLGLNINSPFKLGDKLSFDGMISNGEDILNYDLTYGLPLSFDGLRAEVGYSQLHYDLVKEYKNLNADGDSKIVDVMFEYALLRTQEENLKTSMTLARKDLTDYTDGEQTVDKEIHSLVLGLDYSNVYSFFNYNASISSNVFYTYGDLETSDEDASSGAYHKMNLYVSHILQLSNDVSFTSTLSAQQNLTNENLDGSEDLSIGGVYGVKVYPSGEQSAENGYLINLELDKQLAAVNKYNHRVGIFYDIGNVYMEDPSFDSSFERRTLQDFGLSYNASFKSFFSNFYLAKRIDEEVTSEDNYDYKFLFQVGMLF